MVNALLSLDTWEKGLVLPQRGMLDFGDSPREALLTLRSGWRVGRGWGAKKGREWEVELICKMKKK